MWQTGWDCLPQPAFKLWGSDLLGCDLRVSSGINRISSYGSWVELPFTDFPDPFLGLSNGTVAALLRSEVDFSRVIQTNRSNHVLEGEDSCNLYHMTTRMGWVRGCQILLDAELSFIPSADCRDSIWLLRQAVDSGSQAMVHFWLTVRDDATTEQLKWIGSLEGAVMYAYAKPETNLAETLATHLVGQRHKLRRIAELADIDCECVKRSNGVLDAHAACAVRVLDQQDIEIPPSLRPIAQLIYNVREIYDHHEHSIINGPPRSILGGLQYLYNIGFNDIARGDIECHQNVYWPPLYHAIRRYRFSYQQSGLFEMVDWFLAKGANITDCWPRSRIAMLHCLSSKAALIIFPWDTDESSSVGMWERVVPMFRYNITDNCECSCSTHGGTGITYFFRHASSYSWTTGGGELLNLMRLKHIHLNDRDYYGKLRRTVQCVERAAEDEAHRWIITEFIRLCVFNWLGIRHTCYDLSSIMNPRCICEFSLPPAPWYSRNDLHRIQEEDAYLVSLLEYLVPLFDARYDTHEGDLLSFVDDVLAPEMNIVLDQMKKEDEAAHAAGRREMGVVMTEEHGSYMYEEYESDSADESESDDRREKWE